jgi:hypothetical protein
MWLTNCCSSMSCNPAEFAKAQCWLQRHMTHVRNCPCMSPSAPVHKTPRSHTQSDLVKVFVGPGHEPHEVSRISGVGFKAHGLVAWGKDLILLDSDNGALVSLDTESGEVYDLYQVWSRGRLPA